MFAPSDYQKTISKKKKKKEQQNARAALVCEKKDREAV